VNAIPVRVAALALLASLGQGCSGSGGAEQNPPGPPPANSPPPPVQISVAAASIAEGDSGPTALQFAVSLSAAAASDVTVSYATSNGSGAAAAAGGVDYDSASGTLTIARGSTSAQISVMIVGDEDVEQDETFVLTLSNPSSNATLASASAVGTIRNDDALTPIPGAGAGLNDTGVVLCSNGSGNGFDCGSATSGTDQYPRQDAQHGRDVTAADSVDGRAGFSFTKLDADGVPLPDQSTSYASAAWACVQDNVTGLRWEVKADDDGPRDRDSTYTWYEPAGENDGDPGDPASGACAAGQVCDTQGYATLLNDSMHCGRDDWRLPTQAEALSLIDYGAATPLYLDGAFIANEVPATYWTADSFDSQSGAVDAQGHLRQVSGRVVR
jgi:uncharacterized protein DUF1566/Calx-beta domain-containing protein